MRAFGRSARGCVAVTAALLACAAAAAQVADAGGRQTVQCVGALGAVTVDADVVVPTGASCQLAGTDVLGSVTVETAASLSTSAGASIRDDLTCGGDLCQLADTTVGGAGLQTSAGGAFAAFASSLESLDCAAGTCAVGPDLATGLRPSAVDRDIRVGAGASLSTSSARIGGDLSCRGCDELVVFDSTLGGSVDSQGETGGSFLCNDVVAGNVRYAFGQAFFFSCNGSVIGGHLQLLHDSGLLSVTSSTVGGSLQLLDDQASEIDLFDNRVRLSILCVNLQTPPIGADNSAGRIDPSCGPIS